MFDAGQHSGGFHDTAELFHDLSADDALGQTGDDLGCAADEDRATDLVRLLEQEADDCVTVGLVRGIHQSCPQNEHLLCVGLRVAQRERHEMVDRHTAVPGQVGLVFRHEVNVGYPVLQTLQH